RIGPNRAVEPDQIEEERVLPRTGKHLDPIRPISDHRRQMGRAGGSLSGKSFNDQLLLEGENSPEGLARRSRRTSRSVLEWAEHEIDMGRGFCVRAGGEVQPV